jgi:RimJ/RimL family protein N-acetyltransferase
MAMLPPPSMMILTDRFVMRPMMRGDASPRLESWIDDDVAAEMLNTRRRKWSVAEQADYFARHEGQQERLLLGIYPKREKEPIGLFILRLQPHEGIFVVSHLIGDKAWRGSQKVTFETSEAVYDYFFNSLGYAKAKAHVRPENKPMLWLIHTYVWKKEALLAKHLRLAASGERSDLLIFSILADEWRARPEKFRFKPEAAARAANVGSNKENR